LRQYDTHRRACKSDGNHSAGDRFARHAYSRLLINFSLLSNILATHTRCEWPRDNEDTIHDLERQRRQTPRRRTVNDARGIARIEFRFVTFAIQQVLRGNPPTDVAAFVRAD